MGLERTAKILLECMGKEFWFDIKMLFITTFALREGFRKKNRRG